MCNLFKRHWKYLTKLSCRKGFLTFFFYGLHKRERLSKTFIKVFAFWENGYEGKILWKMGHPQVILQGAGGNTRWMEMDGQPFGSSPSYLGKC